MKLSLEKTRAFWLYIAGGIIALTLGVMLLPIWRGIESLFFSSWGEFAINIMMSGALIAYILLYLVKRIRRYSGTPAQIVAIVELVLMVVIAVVCTVSTFTDVVSFGEICQVFGLALWTRGAAGVFTGYYCDSTLVRENAKKKKSGKEKEPNTDIDTDEEPRGRVDDFTVWRLAFAVILISAGTYLVVNPPIGDDVFQWAFSCAVIFIGLFIAIYGASLKPVKIKVKAEKENTDVETVKDTDTNDTSAKENDTKGRSKFSSKKKGGTPLLEEGKVNVKLSKDEKSTEEKAEPKAEEKTEPKADSDVKLITAKEPEQEPLQSQSIATEDKMQEQSTASPWATTALVPVDKKNDKKSKKK